MGELKPSKVKSSFKIPLFSWFCFTPLFMLFLTHFVSAQVSEFVQKDENLQEVRENEWASVTIDVVPGFVKIRIDHEQLFGFSDRILLPTGNHWIEIIAPKGYQDTAFKISLPHSTHFQQQVRLKNIKSGKFAPVGRSVSLGSSMAWSDIATYSSLSLGVFSGLLALREHSQASDSWGKYRIQTHPIAADAWYSKYQDHIESRNILGLFSSIGLGAGLCFWLFF